MPNRSSSTAAQEVAEVEAVQRRHKSQGRTTQGRQLTNRSVKKEKKDFTSCCLAAIQINKKQCAEESRARWPSDDSEEPPSSSSRQNWLRVVMQLEQVATCSTNHNAALKQVHEAEPQNRFSRWRSTGLHCHVKTCSPSSQYQHVSNWDMHCWLCSQRWEKESTSLIPS